MLIILILLRWLKACGSEQAKIKSLEQIYLFSLPVKEYQIVEYFLGSALKDEVMKIMPVQKQTRAGQRTRFKVELFRTLNPVLPRTSCGLRLQVKFAAAAEEFRSDCAHCCWLAVFSASWVQCSPAAADDHCEHRGQCSSTRAGFLSVTWEFCLPAPARVLNLRDQSLSQP